TTTTTFDPETGEILGSGDAGDREAPAVGGAAVGSAPADPVDSPDPGPTVPPANPALVFMADLSTHRAAVAKWLAFDRHEQVMDAMTAEQRADYRSFVLSVFNHASATIDHLDAPARLKAVQ